MKIKFLIILFTCFLLSFSCTVKKVRKISTLSVWENFISHQKQLNTINSFLLKGAVHIRDKNKKHRLIYTCFGKFNKIIRFNISSSLGQTLSMWQVTPHNFLVFFPYEKIAYTSNNPNLKLIKLGYPLPFNLNKTVELLLGKISIITKPRSILIENNTIKYIFNDNNINSLILNHNGTIKELVLQNYKINFLKYKKISSFYLPSKIYIYGPKDFFLKIYQKKIKPTFKLDKIELTLPKEVQVYQVVN
ncbi:hypothetical protein [Desulfonauticus submarinus]